MYFFLFRQGIGCVNLSVSTGHFLPSDTVTMISTKPTTISLGSEDIIRYEQEKKNWRKKCEVEEDINDNLKVGGNSEVPFHRKEVNKRIGADKKK